MGEAYLTVPPSVIPGADRITVPEAEPVESRVRGHRMDSIRDMLEAARTNGLAAGRFRGLLHVAIGRSVSMPDGTKISSGATWRELAALLKALRYDPELGREAGADPDTLSPRDRERYWYAVIALARVDGPEARAEAEQLIAPLKAAGFVVAPTVGAPTPMAPKAKPSAKEKPEKRSEKAEEKHKKKKK